MKLKITLIILASILFANCKNEKAKNNKSEQLVVKSNDFKTFINTFKKLEVPLIIEPLKIQDGNFTQLTKTDLKFIDLQDIDPNLDNIYAYGILPDTLDTYKVIYLFPYEIRLPKMATYSKNGKKISEEELAVGGCGSDCGFTCNEYVKIYSDLKIYSVDSIQSYECDSLGIKENTLKKYTRFKNGSINIKGQIIMSPIVEKNQ
ncbi:MAG: hypothetical protein WC760_11585 [Bacteroidia bacterium]|jgi:hypothetical protein